MSSGKDSKQKKDLKDNEKKFDLGALEEDDDFEEFPTEDWTEKNENTEDLHVWEDDWDDDNIEDDFSQQLRDNNGIHSNDTIGWAL